MRCKRVVLLNIHILSKGEIMNYIDLDFIPWYHKLFILAASRWAYEEALCADFSDFSDELVGEFREQRFLEFVLDFGGCLDADLM
jgi:hypothetical protein